MSGIIHARSQCRNTPSNCENQILKEILIEIRQLSCNLAADTQSILDSNNQLSTQLTELTNIVLTGLEYTKNDLKCIKDCVCRDNKDQHC
jgi:hypothetical protein